MDHKSFPRKSHSRAGFSLVEVIVSAGILALVLSATLLLFINAIILNQTSRDITIATSHAQYVLENIRNSAFANVPGQINGSAWDWNLETVQSKMASSLKNESIATRCLDSGGVEISCSSASGPLRVKVTVSWTDVPGRTRSIAVNTQMGGA